MVKQIAGSNNSGKVGHGIEDWFYQDGGIPTIIRGPSHIAQAHKSDEWVAEFELKARDGFIRRLAKRLLA